MSLYTKIKANPGLVTRRIRSKLASSFKSNLNASVVTDPSAKINS